MRFALLARCLAWPRANVSRHANKHTLQEATERLIWALMSTFARAVLSVMISVEYDQHVLIFSTQ
eukprot:5271683-Amphidinium_carterae.1